MTQENESKKNNDRGSFDFDKLQEFMKNNPSLMKKEETKSIFSLGVLVHLVLALQMHFLQSSPFEDKLKGLNITAKDIDRIYKEAVEKIKQYEDPRGSNYYKELRQYLAESLLINKEKINKISNQEISFNFVCGLELGRKFKS